MTQMLDAAVVEYLVLSKPLFVLAGSAGFGDAAEVVGLAEVSAFVGLADALSCRYVNNPNPMTTIEIRQRFNIIKRRRILVYYTLLVVPPAHATAAAQVVTHLEIRYSLSR